MTTPDDTFNALRRPTFEDMKEIVSDFESDYWSREGLRSEDPDITDILDEHHWTLDEFKNRIKNERG